MNGVAAWEQGLIDDHQFNEWRTHLIQNMPVVVTGRICQCSVCVMIREL